ncbi:MAG: hypothetical protein WB789_08250 [Thermoplasmata archaeon]
MDSESILEIPSLNPQEVYRFVGRARFEKEFREAVSADARGVVKSTFGIDLGANVSLKEIEPVSTYHRQYLANLAGQVQRGVPVDLAKGNLERPALSVIIVDRPWPPPSSVYVYSNTGLFVNLSYFTATSAAVSTVSVVIIVLIAIVIIDGPSRE